MIKADSWSPAPRESHPGDLTMPPQGGLGRAALVQFGYPNNLLYFNIL